MYNILRTIEFLGHQILKNEICFHETDIRLLWNDQEENDLLFFHNKMTKKKMILVTGVTARKRSESDRFLQICEIWLNYV